MFTKDSRPSKDQNSLRHACIPTPLYSLSCQLCSVCFLLSAAYSYQSVDSEHDSAQATFFLPCALLTCEYANTPASAIPVPAKQQESSQRRPLAMFL